MSGMDRPARLFKELASDLSRCSRCGMCQAVCPLFGETREEADVARGKLALLDGMVQQLFDHPDGVMERLNRCLLCGACEANCPNSVPILSIYLKARIFLADVAGLSAIKKAVLRKMLVDPRKMEKWAARGARFQKWAIRPESRSLGTASVRFSSKPVLRHFLPLAESTFSRSIDTVNPEDSKSAQTVLFYPGCLIEYILPNIGKAVLEALSFHRVNVRIPSAAICCGMPAISAGDSRTALNLITQNLAEFEKYEFDYLVTACPTCTVAITGIWPMLCDRQDVQIISALTALSRKTIDISRLLAGKINPGSRLKPPGGAEKTRKVTVHDPCHLKKSLNIFREPRALIASDPLNQVVEMQQSDRCCGMGGSFGMEHVDLSFGIGEKKRSNIADTQCDIVAAGCPACILQLSRLLSSRHSDILVKHPVELYAESLKRGET